MHSNAHEPGYWAVTLKQSRYKLRAYSGYFCGLILAQLLASLLVFEGTHSLGITDLFNAITLRTYSARLVMQFSVIWALIISFAVTSYSRKNAVFTLPGNRLTDSMSDVGFLLVCCLFGAVTTALYGAAFRIVVFALLPGQMLAPGFYPTFSDLYTVAAFTFSNMLLLSAAGYFSGTLLRISMAFVVLVAAVGVFVVYMLSSSALSLPLLGPARSFLLYDQSLIRVVLVSLAAAAALYTGSILIARRLEVK